MERALTDYAFFCALRDHPAVDAIWLFGSRARADAAPRSDIDLAIVCPRAGARDWAAMQALIEDADTLLTIDAVRFDTLAEADPLRTAILRDRVVLFAREAA